MELYVTKIRFLPGFNKQVTSTGAEGHNGQMEKMFVLDMVHLKK
jgi:hypothetical protein